MVSFSLPFRRTFIAALTVVTTLTLLWWGLWTMAATRYKSVLDGWIDGGRAAGYQISFDDRKLFGFPRHLVLRFVNLNWKNTNGIIFHADDIDIAAMPWQWQTFEAKFKHHVEIATALDAENHTLMLGGNDGRARVELKDDGTWRFSRVSLMQAKLGRTPDYLFAMENLNVSADRPDTPPEDHRHAGLTLSGEAINIGLSKNMPSPFGPRMANLKIDMRVMDYVPDVRRRDSMDAWNKDMGVVEFDNLHIEWGALALSARGTMGFDDDLQPEGAFTSSVHNHEDVLKTLMEHGFIAKSQVGMLNSALSLFAKPAGGDMDAVELPVAIQLGGLFLGPVRIFTFPEIQWPTAPPL
jgi:hypothetical protein